MENYLIDTNICIFSLSQKFNLQHKFETVGFRYCYVSEIVKAELFTGAYSSSDVQGNLSTVKRLLSKFGLLTISEHIETFARLRASLAKQGQIIEDFDILVAACALDYNLTLVTNNTKHFKRIPNLKLEDWTKE